MNEEKIKFTIGQIIKHNSLEDSVEKIFTFISQMKVEDGYDMDYVRQAFQGGRDSVEAEIGMEEWTDELVAYKVPIKSFKEWIRENPFKRNNHKQNKP